MNRQSIDEAIAKMYGDFNYVSNYVFYAHLIAQCNLKITNETETAGVAFIDKSYDLYINPEFFEKLPVNQRIGVLAHEMQHILQNHHERRQERDHHEFNVAADCAINQLIKEDDLPLPNITPKSLSEQLNIEVPLNLSSELYYDLLQENKKESNNSNNIKIFDDHEIWNKSTGPETLRKEVTKQMMEKAARETIKSMGNLPSDYNDCLELFSNKSQVNWKQLLRNIVSNKRSDKRSTIKRKNRRFPDRKDLRGTTKNRTFELLVVADVSGSMNDEALVETLNEIHHICKLTNTDVNLIQVDTEAHEPELLKKNSKTFTRKANGGTYLNKALEKAKECKLNYDAIVVCTDGGLFSDDIDYFKNLNKRIIWLVEKEGNIMDKMNTGKMIAVKLD